MCACWGSFVLHVCLCVLHIFFCECISCVMSKVSASKNPFTPASSSSSGDDILASSGSLEEGLRQAQLRGMRSIEKQFTQVESIYKNIHGEAVSQQSAIDLIEDQTLKTALLTGETAEELKITKQKRDKRFRLKIYCIAAFLLVVGIWLFVVLHTRHE